MDILRPEIEEKGSNIMPTEIKFEITDHLATLSTSPKGWTKELNLVSWNGAAAKYDIRDWSPDHSKMGKGVTLSVDEMRELKKVIEQIK